MVKVGARVLDFGALIAVTTGAGMLYVKMFGQSEEDKEAMLRQKYPDLIRQSQANRKPMQDFFDTMKRDVEHNQKASSSGSSGSSDVASHPITGEAEAISENQKRFDSILKGGKSKQNQKPGANANAGIYISGTTTGKETKKPELIPLTRKEKKEQKKRREMEMEKEKECEAKGGTWWWPW